MGAKVFTAVLLPRILRLARPVAAFFCAEVLNYRVHQKYTNEQYHEEPGEPGGTWKARWRAGGTTAERRCIRHACAVYRRGENSAM